MTKFTSKEEALQFVTEAQKLRQNTVMLLDGLMDKVMEIIKISVADEKHKQLEEVFSNFKTESPLFIDELVTKVCTHLSDLLTEEEAFAYAEFFSSPVGKSVLNKCDTVGQITKRYSEKWGSDMATNLIKRLEVAGVLERG
jgi:hypothetical protein